ncbi:autotransporter outer membrane beta-barrel domain-containing protein [Chitinolyticbacter meiyuanensis]|uniref:autotransporter outer membrane beta-barrel domain-containing protein n=1 Tax=Chitinolyticbacter meiyuanensis TaxID=682798 RepID=UPI0011E58904|nr:autotransporter outer membrane beta-barrel domain-containing protein [Chitinolyticbacter meiyuanensis]
MPPKLVSRVRPGQLRIWRTLFTRQGNVLQQCVLPLLLAIPLLPAHGADSAQPRYIKALSLSADSTTSVLLPRGSAEAPFVDATIVDVQPAEAGMATLSARQPDQAVNAAPQPRHFALAFAATRGFAGVAVVTCAMRDAAGAVSMVELEIDVDTRRDPALDSDAPALISAQSRLAQRFASTQLGNVGPRLPRLHRPETTRNTGQLKLRVNGSTVPLREQRALEGLADQLPGATLWSTGTLYVDTQDNRVDVSTGGLTVGSDYLINRFLTAGIGLGYGYGSNEVGFGSTERAQYASATLYGSLRPWQSLYLDAILGYGDMRFDPRRLRDEDGELAQSQRQGGQAFGSLAIGYDYHLDGLRISPYGRLELVRTQLDRYSEGAEAIGALDIAEQDLDKRSGSMGVYIDGPLSWGMGTLTPFFTMEYQYWRQQRDDALLRYADLANSPTYRIAYDPNRGTQTSYGLGFDWALPADMAFGLRYDYIAGDEQSGRGTLTARKRF